MCIIDRTCDICAFWSAAQWELFVKKRSYFDRMKPSCPSGYVPPAPLASPARKLLRVFRNWAFFLFSFPHFRWSGVKEGGSGCTWYCVPGGFLPAGSRSSERGGSASGLLSVARSRFAGSFGSWRRASCSIAAVFFLCPLRSSVISHLSPPHARRRGELWEISEDRYRVLSSRGSRSSDRGAQVDKRARSQSGGFR